MQKGLAWLSGLRNFRIAEGLCTRIIGILKYPREDV